MKYCDIHGAVEVGTDVTACPKCNTLLVESVEQLTAATAQPKAGAQLAVAADSDVNLRTARTRGKQAAFLEAFALSCRIDKSAVAAGIHRQMHYDWLEDDPVYRELFGKVKPLAAQMLMDEAVSRSVDGWDEPVFHAGLQCGVIRKKSDRLLERLLEFHYPEFRSRQSIEHTGKDGKPLIPLEAFDALLKQAATDDDGGTSP